MSKSNRSNFIKQYEARVNAILHPIANLYNDNSLTREQVDLLVQKVNDLCLFLTPVITIANKGNQKYPPRL